MSSITVTSRTWCLLIGCWLCLNTAQAQLKQPWTHPTDERIIRLLATSYWSDGDSATVVNRLDSVRLRAHQQHDVYMDTSCQYLILRCRLNYHIPFNLGIRQLEAARPQLEANSFPEIRAAYWHIYGLYLLDHLQFEQSFRLLLRAQQQFDQIGYANVPEIIDYLYGMGSFYFRFGDYQRTIHFLTLAERYHPPQPFRLRTAVLNTLGLAHQKLGHYAQAERVFRTALNLAQVTADSAYWGILSGNLGNTLRLRGQYRQALPYLYQDLALGQRRVPENSATTCLYLAKVLLALDSTAKAKAYIDRSVRLAGSQPRRGVYLLNYSEARASYARQTGNLAQALWWTDSTTTLRDSLRTVYDRALLLSTERRVQAEQYLANLHTLEEQKAQAVLIRNGIIAALLLLTLTGLYALRQRAQKQYQQQQFAAEQLTQYMVSLRDKNELIARITDDLAQARQLAQLWVPDDTGQSIQMLLGSVILTEQDWQKFRRLFERVHPGFFARLDVNYPDLSPTELRLLALTKLSLPTKDMAYMLGVSTEAIRKARYRLRRKLEDKHPGTNLEALLAQL